MSTKEMLLVMELMTRYGLRNLLFYICLCGYRGSLHDVLHNPKIDLTFDMKIHLACQAAQGINFLHQSSPPIIHRYAIFVIVRAISYALLQ